MKTRSLILLSILGVLIAIFAWSMTNYIPLYSSPDTYSGNSIDLYGIPMIITILVIPIVIAVIIYILLGNYKWRLIFAPLSGVGIFLIFGFLVLRLVISST